MPQLLFLNKTVFLRYFCGPERVVYTSKQGIAQFRRVMEIQFEKTIKERKSNLFPLHQRESSNKKSKTYTEASQHRTNAASTQGIDIYILRDILQY